MPEAVLAILRLVFLAGLYLFLARVLRAVWVEIFAERQSAANAVRSGVVRNEPGPRVAKPVVHEKKRRRKDAPPMLKIVEPPELLGTTFAIDDEMTIGRASGCAVCIDDTFASQLHARVFRRERQIFVEDLGSTNGTFLNRKPVHGPLRIERGDRIQIGNTVLELTR